MGTLIDSSVLIAAERPAPDLDALMGAQADEPVGIAARVWVSATGDDAPDVLGCGAEDEHR